MASSINPNNISVTFPVAGQDNDSQGFRDNFNNIQNNEKYLTTYFNKSLKPYNLSIEHEPMTVYNNNSQVQYKNIIRNMFFKQLMENTETVVNNIDSYGNMIDNLYNKQIIKFIFEKS